MLELLIDNFVVPITKLVCPDQPSSAKRPKYPDLTKVLADSCCSERPPDLQHVTKRITIANYFFKLPIISIRRLMTSGPDPINSGSGPGE